MTAAVPAPLCDVGRCAQILAALAEARAVERVAERHGQILAGVIGRVFDAANLSAEQRTAGLAALQRELAALAGGADQRVAA